MHMVTIRDVARHAGVSVATVSRVINKTDIVSDELSRRVQQSIAELGFEPDFLARTWRTRVTHTIAAVVSDNTSPHHGTVLREAAAVALAHDYNLILCTTFRDPGTESRYLRMLRSRRVDGVILNNVGACDKEIRALTETGVPIVLLNRPLANYGPLVDAVVVDSYRGSFDLVSHLIDQGHQRIAMICGGLHEFHKRGRLQGYRDALQAHGLAYDDCLVRDGSIADEENPQRVVDILSLRPRPTALYTSSYNTGLAAMKVLRAQGIRIPDDIAFAMFDDVAWGEFIEPPLTLVRNPAEEMGRKAMDLLFTRLADRERPPQQILLRPSLIIRRSSGRTVSCAETPATKMATGALDAIVPGRR